MSMVLCERWRKNKILDLFNLEPVADESHGHISIIDMGMIWRLATPTSQDRESKKEMELITFRFWLYDLDKIRGIVFSHHHDTCLLILMNDRYDLPFSLKDDERGRMASQHFYISRISIPDQECIPRLF